MRKLKIKRKIVDLIIEKFAKACVLVGVTLPILLWNFWVWTVVYFILVVFLEFFIEVENGKEASE